MDHVARSLQLDVEAVKRANLYQKDQVSAGLAASVLKLMGSRGFLVCSITFEVETRLGWQVPFLGTTLFTHPLVVDTLPR